MDALLAGLIFAAVYALIATERVDKTLAALLGGTVVILLGIVSQETAFEAIDLNVIFLLAGMMVLAGGLSRTGFFDSQSVLLLLATSLQFQVRFGVWLSPMNSTVPF